MSDAMGTLRVIGAVIGVLTGTIAVYKFVSPYILCPRYDVTGNWEIETSVVTVGSVEHLGESGKVSVFRANLNQNCDQITGTATKVRFGGSEVGPSDRSYLDFGTSRVSGNDIYLDFVERWQGSSSTSNGSINLKYDSINLLMTGSFSSAVGQIDGRVVARKFDGL